MKKDRIKAAEQFKNEIDEFYDLKTKESVLFDSSHVNGINVLKKFAREWRHKKHCTRKNK